MPRYIIENTSGDQRQMDYEASDEAEAIRHYISHHSPLGSLLQERTEDNYKGWKKIEISIGPATCDECFTPSDENPCRDCKQIKIKCSDIEWDTDGQEVDLPTEVVIEVSQAEWEDDDTLAADTLSDEHGFCIKALVTEEIK